MKFSIIFLVILSFSSYAQQNFNQAKQHLIKIYTQHPEQKEFYCGCDFSWQGKKALVDLESCGYQVRKNRERAQRIEWEHVMPAYNFGNQLQCWQQGGRKNCTRSTEFNLMEGDMHNLQPAIGEVNGDRSNHGYGQFTKNFTQYGQCQIAVDFKLRLFQPRDDNKGMIARSYLYMADKYHIRLSKQEQQLMHVWNQMYPPQQWECQRNQLIAVIQGNDNHFVSESCPLF